MDQAATRARPFATRLGVALTVATRAAEPHFLQNFESLTELPNRRHLRERSSQEVSRASRTNSSLALLHVDLDQFMRVNDGTGHEVGDVVLKEAADRLRCHLREEDSIAHFGGDEFVLLLPGISGAADAGRVAEKLLALLSQPFSVDASDVESCAVASAILGIVHSLGKEVCAEGVETESQRTYLTQRGCELLQCYRISPPLPANDFEAFLRRCCDQGAPFPACAVRGTQTRAAEDAGFPPGANSDAALKNRGRAAVAVCVSGNKKLPFRFFWPVPDQRWSACLPPKKSSRRSTTWPPCPALMRR